MTSKDFQEVAIKDCNHLLPCMETRLPRSAMMCNVLQLWIENATSNDTITFKVLAYNGDLDSNQSFILVIIKVKGLPINLVVLSSPLAPTDEMLTSLIKAIDWSQANQFEGIENTIVQTLITHGRQVGKIVDHDPIELYYIPTDKKLGLPPHSDSVIVKQLSTKDALKVNSRWPAAGEGTSELLATSIDLVGSAGVYLKSKELELVSWAIALPFGSIHALHTEPNHQRKGYALLTMTAVSQFVAKQNRIPIVQIYKSNDTSKSVNEKVGYIYSHDINLVHYYPLP